ncbi:uncharacterized protein LOC101238777 isoform X2 [Hydra vulgaris]|uniref:Uncharacterized protein LOC101238777 isoform X2 n=1 Tax=Hydra vulgaris TaxID=6087 RepID=A0ABM4CYZ7_HYDVU
MSMLHHDLNALPVKDQVNNTNEKKQWPYLLWIYLKSLGLYHNGPFVTVRRCSKCKGIGHEDFTSSGSFKMYHCEVCESFLWDHDGHINFITDEIIGAKRLNHRGSFLLSNIWLLLIVTSILTLIVIDFINFKRSSSDIVELFSSICLKVLLTIPTFIAVVCNFFTTFHEFAPGVWASAISPVFIVQRLRWINMRKTRMAGYGLFFGSIFFIAIQCSRVTQDLYAYDWNFNYFTPMEYFTIVVGIFNFGGISYLAYLLRKSFEKEVRLVCKFATFYISNVDLCRLRLAATFDTFHVFREFTSGWMSMNVVFAIISTLLEIHVWIVATEKMPLYRYERLVFLFSCFILPILVIGNVSVDYLWNRLVRQISRMRNSHQEQNWDKLMQFLNEQKPGNRPWQSVMAFILSIIAVFSAIQFRLLNSKAINNATSFQGINVTEVFG